MGNELTQGECRRTNPVALMTGLVGTMCEFEPELKVVAARRLLLREVYSQRWKVVLSDEVDTIVGVCGVKLSRSLEGGIVQEGSIIRLKSFSVTLLLDGVTRVCAVGDFTVVVK